MVGSCMTDLITTVARMPVMGETLPGTSFSIGFGGKGANQAVAAARLGASVALVACLGDDDFGRATLDNLNAEGIDARFVRMLAGATSGVAPITVQEDGQNIVLIVPGANERMDTDSVRDAARLIKGARVVLCQLEIPDEPVLAAFRAARSNGVRTILNPAPARELPQEIVALADVIVPNETELEILTGVSAETPKEIEEGARRLRSRPDQVVIVTLGARGAWVLDGDSSYRVEAETARAVDTTGAGDAFVGTLAAMLAREVPLSEAIALSCRVATESVKRAGTQTSFPRADALRAIGVDLPRRA